VPLCPVRTDSATIVQRTSVFTAFVLLTSFVYALLTPFDYALLSPNVNIYYIIYVCIFCFYSAEIMERPLATADETHFCTLVGQAPYPALSPLVTALLCFAATSWPRTLLATYVAHSTFKLDFSSAIEGWLTSCR